MKRKGAGAVLQPLTKQEWQKIGQGLLVLLLVVAVGIGLVGRQLAALTWRHEDAWACRMGRTAAGDYQFCWLGQRYQLPAQYPLGEIQANRRLISLRTDGQTWQVPLYWEWDCRAELAQLAQQRQRLLAEYFK